MLLAARRGTVAAIIGLLRRELPVAVRLRRRQMAAETLSVRRELGSRKTIRMNSCHMLVAGCVGLVAIAVVAGVLPSVGKVRVR